MSTQKETQIIDIILPKMGESVMEAILSEWFFSEGETIKKDEPLALIGTDKVESELPSEFDGILKEILVPTGHSAKVGDTIARMEISAAIVVKKIESLKDQKPAQNQQNTTSHILSQKELPDHTHLTPVVRKIAAEHGLTQEELFHIPRSGAHNRLTKKDVEEYLKPKGTEQFFKPVHLDIEAGDQPQDISNVRKKIAENLTHGYQTIPHVTTFVEADVTELVKFRDDHKEAYQKKHQTKLTYTHLIMYALVETLKKYPQFNSWSNGHQWIWKKNIHLGFATALPNQTLLVPNVKTVNEMRLEELVKKVNDTARKAKEGKLAPDNLQGTTFTVSNTGIFGSLMGTPIISVPQVAILALGNIKSGAGVLEENGQEYLAIRKKMFLSLSYDHRFIDGALASKFLSHLCNIIENKF